MTDIGYAAAVLLASLFVVAAGAKLARRDEAAGAFSALALPAPSFLSWGVPVAELALGAALLATPRLGGVLAVAALVAFSAALVRAIRLGVVAPCGCFGAARSEPMSFVELVRNGMFLILAVAALAAERPAVPSLESVMAVALAAVSGAVVLALVDLGRRVGALFDNSSVIEGRARL